MLALKVTKGELEKILGKNKFTDRIDRGAFRLEIGKSDREIWLLPVAVRAPMGHTKNTGGVVIEDHKTSYQLNSSVGNTLGGGFHCTMLDSIERIFSEGLGPGGGGDRVNTFFVPRDIGPPNMTHCQRLGPGSRNGHILVQQAIPFSSFDAVW